MISLVGLNAPLCLSFPIRMLNRHSGDTLVSASPDSFFFTPTSPHPLPRPSQMSRTRRMTNRRSEYFLPVKRSPFSCLTGSGYDTVRRPAAAEEEEEEVEDATE